MDRRFISISKKRAAKEKIVSCFSPAILQAVNGYFMKTFPTTYGEGQKTQFRLAEIFIHQAGIHHTLKDCIQFFQRALVLLLPGR